MVIQRGRRHRTITASAQFYPTFGTPNDALVTDDGATVPCPGNRRNHTVPRGAHPATKHFHHGCSGFQHL